MGGESFMKSLRGQVRRMIGDNALAMIGAGPPAMAPEKQWWNLPAKVEAGNRIAAEERARSIELDPDHDPHNDEFDAMRHARWSNRMSTEIGPIFSRVAGAGHELENMLPSRERLAAYRAPRGLQDLARARQWHGESEAEALMDKRNNAEGRLAAAQGRAIDPSRLQTALDRPASGNPAYPQARPRRGGGGTR